MRYKEIYYAKAEKRNAYVHKLKHDNYKVLHLTDNLLHLEKIS